MSVDFPRVRVLPETGQLYEAAPFVAMCRTSCAEYGLVARLVAWTDGFRILQTSNRSTRRSFFEVPWILGCLLGFRFLDESGTERDVYGVVAVLPRGQALKPLENPPKYKNAPTSLQYYDVTAREFPAEPGGWFSL